jgi:hypothetical protein
MGCDAVGDPRHMAHSQNGPNELLPIVSLDHNHIRYLRNYVSSLQAKISIRKARFRLFIMGTLERINHFKGSKKAERAAIMSNRMSSSKSQNISWHNTTITKKDRERLLRQEGHSHLNDVNAPNDERSPTNHTNPRK